MANTTDKKISVIIPAAGCLKMRSHGVISNMDLHGETVLARQIRLIEQSLNVHEVIVVTGYQEDRIRRVTPHHIKLVQNHKYEETGVAHSIVLGVRVATYNNFLVIYGNTVFSESVISGLDLLESFAIIENPSQAASAGVVMNKNLVTNFSYNLPVRWRDIIYLTDKEGDKLIGLARNRKGSFNNNCGFELFNSIIDSSANISGRPLKKNEFIVELSTPPDLATAIKLVNKDE